MLGSPTGVAYDSIKTSVPTTVTILLSSSDDIGDCLYIVKYPPISEAISSG